MTYPTPLLRPVPLKSTTIEDDFWRERIRVNREVTIPIEYGQYQKTGRIEAFSLSPTIERGDAVLDREWLNTTP